MVIARGPGGMFAAPVGVGPRKAQIIVTAPPPSSRRRRRDEAGDARRLGVRRPAGRRFLAEPDMAGRREGSRAAARRRVGSDDGERTSR